MIKIQDHLKRADAEAYISDLADQHWNYLNKIRKDLSFGEGSLIQSCVEAERGCLTHEYLATIGENDPNKVKRHADFFTFLSANNFRKLKEIIVGKPSDLVLLKIEILNILNEGDLFSINDGKVKQTLFGDFLEKRIFKYSKYRKSKKCRETLIKLGFESASCPYCNLNRLVVTVKHKEHAYMELDHFFLKAEHPYFAISFFNLVPSCHSCNAIDKGITKFSLESHINPFYESFDSIYKFDFSPSFLLGSKDEFQLMNVSSKKSDITAATFNLTAKYENRVSDLRSLVSQFTKYKHKLKTSEKQDFIEMLLREIPTNGNDILRFELAKAKRDLLKDLDLENELNIR